MSPMRRDLRPSRPGAPLADGRRKEWCRMTLLTTSDAAADSGLDAETLKMTLEAIRDYVCDAIPEERQLQLDHDDVCPEDVVRGMCSDQLGVQLLFIPEEYG